MRPSVSILILTAGAVTILGAYALSFADAATSAPWLLAIGSVLVLTGLGLLGAGERAPRLAAAVLVACALTFVGFATALLLTPHAAGGPLLLGLPRATTLMLLLTGAVPLVMLPIAYAMVFTREVSTDD